MHKPKLTQSISTDLTSDQHEFSPTESKGENSILDAGKEWLWDQVDYRAAISAAEAVDQMLHDAAAKKLLSKQEVVLAP